MPTYLLDANVLSYFLNTGHHVALGDCAKRVSLAVVGEVREETMVHRTHGRTFAAWLPESGIGVRDIDVGSPAHGRLLELHPDPSVLRDKGERASIALASTDPTLVFVANDRNALWLALRELHQKGERIVGVPVFLRRLLEDAALAPGAADDVLRQSGTPTPTWWADFRASLSI